VIFSLQYAVNTVFILQGEDSLRVRSRATYSLENLGRSNSPSSMTA